MKKHFLFASALLFLAACNKPAERPAVVNSKVADKIFAISDLAEITSAKKAVLVSGGPNADVTKMDASLKQIKIEGKIDAIIKKIKSEAPKADLEKQLKSGAVAMVILKDQIKIFKIMPDAAAAAPSPDAPADPKKPATPTTTEADADIAPTAGDAAAASQELLTMKYLNKLKEHSKSSDARAQADIASELDKAKGERPNQIGETYGFLEIASITVEKVGVLDNERTDYGEKKSLLNVIEGPFELATHLIVGEEKTAAKKTGEGGEESAKDAE